MYDFLIYVTLSTLSGALFGLIPFFVGKHKRKPGLAQFGWLCSTASGIIFLQLPVAIGFMIAIFVLPNDFSPWKRKEAPVPPPPPAAPQSRTLGIACLSGPMKGRVYVISPQGLLIGRDSDCAICFVGQAPGVSRRHCSLRWQQDTLMLTDLDSAYGTYLADGRKLPPQYPTPVGAGSRFYLADQKNLFQIVIT